MSVSGFELTLRPSTTLERLRDDGSGRLLFVGGVGTLVMMIALFAWALTMQIASAAVATGEVTVEGNRKAVQHRDGGPIEAVYVREGQRVVKGQPLVKLNLGEEQSSETVLRTQLLQTLARLARLRAESGGGELLTPSELAGPDGRAVMQQEEELFRARSDAYLGQVGLLDQQIEGAHRQIEALSARSAANSVQLQTVREEADSIASLVSEGLITKSRKLALDRAAAEYVGDQELINAQVAEQQSGIGQAALRKAQLQKDRQESIAKDLGDAEAQLAEVQPKLQAIRERLARGMLVAPEDGFVFGLSAFGPGAVIVPGQTVLEIVPADEALVLNVEIKPTDIDQVREGQPVTVQLLAYRQRYQLKLSGVLKHISADEIDDKARQVKYFQGTIELNKDAIKRSGAEIVPGMPVQVMIETGSRTMMGYFLDPLLKTYEYALRDD